MPRTLSTLVLLALAQAVLAQDRPPAEESNTPAKPRPAIRLLQNPYDLASFYRAGGSAPDGWAGLTRDPSYAIADFYRAEDDVSPYGWSRFWTKGYGAPRPVPLAPYRRTIGQNGDLFLMVPFLAPVGPISGAFAGY